MQADGHLYIPLDPGRRLYVGFSVSENVMISGEITATAPIDVRVIGNTGGDVFPYNLGDISYYASFSTTNAKIAPYSAFSGALMPAGNYALVFTNSGGVASNVTVTQDITVLYPSC
jgi:hypothetical protein